MMFKAAKSSIGLDIGSRFIKFVELKKSGDAIILNKFGIKEIPRDIKVDTGRAIFQLVSQLFSENNIHTRQVNISAGGQSVFVRFVKLLQIKEEKLKQTMKFEAQNQIPFSLNEVAWDWSFLSKDKKTTKKAVIVAIKKNLAEEMVLKLKDIKLSTALIDVSPIVLYNCMAFNEDYDGEKFGALLDIGSKTSNLIIFKEGDIWIRSFPIAGERIEESREQGIEELMGEIERSVEYYFMQNNEELHGDKKLEALILTGGGSAISELETRLGAKFGIRPKILDPLKRLKISKGIFSNAQGEQVKNQLAIAVGLALRGVTALRIEVNFLKDILSERALSNQKNTYSRLSMVMAALILMSFSIFMKQDYSVKRMKVDRIDEMLDIYRTYEPKIKKIEETEDVLKGKIDILYQLAGSRSVWLDALRTISEILPKDVWVTDFSGIVSMEEAGLGRLDLGGKALSYQSVNGFISALKSSPTFRDVKPISSSIDTDANTGEEIVKFSITMDVAVTEK